MSSKPFDTYMGSKDAAGAAERIVGLFPAHGVYVEAFLGGGAVLRRKTPALRSIGIDLDPDVIERWQAHRFPGLELIHTDAPAWLEAHGPSLPADALVYLDPPYVHEARGHHRYAVEMSEADHRRMLAAADALSCSVFISGYESALYSAYFANRTDWRHDTFQAMTRGGPRTEHLWYRVSLASFSADTKYAGRTFRERERIKRKAARWRAKFVQMPGAERSAVLQALLNAERHTTAAAATAGVGDGGSTTPAPQETSPCPT